MIEMLGVLALIGVLSVAGISGYSKAMDMYKLNRFMASYNDLLHQSIILSSQMGYTSSSSGEAHSDILGATGNLPEEFQTEGNRYLRDKFNNLIWFYSYPTMFGLGYNFNSTRFGKDICMALMKIAQANQSRLDYVLTDIRNEDDTGVPYQTLNFLYGPKLCDATKKCLSSLTMTDIDAMCNTCDSRNCRFFINWKLE